VLSALCKMLFADFFLPASCQIKISDSHLSLLQSLSILTMGKNIKNMTRKRVRYGASTYETHLWCYENENYSQEVILCT